MALLIFRHPSEMYAHFSPVSRIKGGGGNISKSIAIIIVYKSFLFSLSLFFFLSQSTSLSAAEQMRKSESCYSSPSLSFPYLLGLRKEKVVFYCLRTRIHWCRNTKTWRKSNFCDEAHTHTHTHNLFAFNNSKNAQWKSALWNRRRGDDDSWKLYSSPPRNVGSWSWGSSQFHLKKLGGNWWRVTTSNDTR